MPFLKSIKVNGGILGIWKLSENSEELKSAFNFTVQENTEFEKFKGERRKIEYLATRLLIQELTGEKSEITYLKSGKPILRNPKKNISISHSADFVVVFLSDENIGIDVENMNRNIDRVAKRFLDIREMEWIKQSKSEQFLKMLFWCAKEAIFKCSTQSGVQFNSQIYIPPFEFKENNCFNATLLAKNQNEAYQLWYFQIENNIIAYCVEVQKSFS
jgi:phosphopantetheinyl transferase